MKPYRTLFEEYKLGLLDDSEIETLHQELIGLYFNNPGKMNKEEVEYTEDLIFELHSLGKLDEKYIHQFKNKVTNDSPFRKRYSLFRNLLVSADILNKGMAALNKDSLPSEDEKREEEELEKVLQEVIEKVHKENQPVVNEPLNIAFSLKFRNFFDDLISQVTFHKPMLRPVVILASLVLILLVVWTSIKPGMKEMTADHSNPDTSNNKQITGYNSDPESQIDTKSKEILSNQDNFLSETKKNATKSFRSPKKMAGSRLTEQGKFDGLLAANYMLPTSFDYTILRSGMSSNANDLFILAADKYNEKDYDSCLIILQDLISSNYFRNSDTLSEINFFLGNCLLQEGMTKNDNKLVELSTYSFKQVDRQNQYFFHSRWYEALAQIKLGNKVEALKILDSLAQNNNVGFGKINSLIDSLKLIMNNNRQK